MEQNVVRVVQRLDKDDPVSLLLGDVVAQSCNQGTVVPLLLAAGLRMVCGCRDMLDVQAGHSVLEIARCELWIVFRQHAVE